MKPSLPDREAPHLLRSVEVARILDVSVRTVWLLVELKQFPQPVRFNRKLVRWKSMDLDAWLSSEERLVTADLSNVNLSR